MLFHNENEADGIQNVMKSLHKYVPYHGDNCDRVYGSQGVVADQLSVERGVNALLEVSNGFTPEERMEGLHLEIADGMQGINFLRYKHHQYLLINNFKNFGWKKAPSHSESARLSNSSLLTLQVLLKRKILHHYL